MRRASKREFEPPAHAHEPAIPRRAMLQTPSDAARVDFAAQIVLKYMHTLSFDSPATLLGTVSVRTGCCGRPRPRLPKLRRYPLVAGTRAAP